MEKLKLFAPIGLYAILIGILYSFAFWDRFFINPLQFASALDIAKVAAWPLTASVLVMFVNFLVSGVTDDDWKQFTHADFILTSIPRRLKLIWKVLWMVGIALLLWWLLFDVATPARWFGIGMCVLLLVSGSIERQTLIRELIPSYSVRAPTISLAVLAPFFAIGAGALAGDTIKSGKGAFILDAGRSYLPATFDESKSHAFVGVLGSLYIFYSSDQAISLVKVGDGQAITLKHNPAAKSKSFY